MRVWSGIIGVDAPTASFDVFVGSEMFKRVSIKQVVRGTMALEPFLSLMLEQARFEEWLRLALTARWRRGE